MAGKHQSGLSGCQTGAITALKNGPASPRRLPRCPSRPPDIRARQGRSGANLPAAAAGQTLGAFALTEPMAGSNPADMRSTATRDGDVWSVTSEATSYTGCEPCEPVVATCDLGVLASGTHTFEHGGDLMVVEVPGELKPSCIGETSNGTKL